jgi:alanine-synthesizing transaminase
MWVLVQPGDAAVVPAPAYPIHLFAPVLAGASVIQVELGGSNEDLYDRLADAFTHSRPRPAR